MFSLSLVCGINVCLVQLQDMHAMQENVRQRNLQFFFSDYLKKNWVNFNQDRVLLSLNWIYYQSLKK